MKSQKELLNTKIIIEASHIYFGGGYVLLETLLRYVSYRGLQCDVYVQNLEVYNSLSNINYKYINIIKTNTFLTLSRYFKKRESVIYFVNLPPFRRNRKSILYFHNEVILSNNYNQKKKFKHQLYLEWLRIFWRNVDVIGCQTKNIEDKLENIRVSRIKILPFYDDLFNNQTNKLPKKDKLFDFCCISSGEPHKNLNILLDAVVLIARSEKISFAMTLEHKELNDQLINRIVEINKELGYLVIKNFGLLTREEIISLYNQSSALVFPSLSESLGLPLIEASLCGLHVISSNRPFSHEVISNPIVFDPLDSGDLASKLISFKRGEFSHLNQNIIINNKISEIINTVL